MTHDDPSLLRRVVGLLLIIMGLVFFSALLPFVVPLGLSGAVLLTWLVAICVGLGVFLLLRVGLRNATKSLLVVLALSLPWFAIFVIPIPSDAQLMFSVFVAFVALFVYRYYTKRHSSPKKTGQG